MNHASLTVELAEGDAERVEALLWDFGATGLEIRDREAPPMPGVRGPHPGDAIIVSFFANSADADEAAAEVHVAFPQARVQRGEQAEEDWSTSWRKHIRALTQGRLWVGPPWQIDQAPPDKIRIVIEPKMAFGTGDHPTTALCLAALDDTLARSPQLSVLDVGTGSGVLAIAARKLGAPHVVGIDNDAPSVTLALENIAQNRAKPIALSTTPLSEVHGVFDVVVANILANTLVELAPDMARHTGRYLFLSGVLAHQRTEVAQAFVAQGLRDVGGASTGDWVRLDFERVAL
ncbi:MAG: 50S ribosomal protein L11 methyltransferase [Myxococcaceae bacterium]